MKPTLLFLPAASLPAAAQIPAFPGAEGYGAYANGGRGGDVYHVTNLNPSGAGSFADGIATVPAAGRTIVFDVSGHIHIRAAQRDRLTESNVTIAGQTAPGDGVGLQGRHLPHFRRRHRHPPPAFPPRQERPRRRLHRPRQRLAKRDPRLTSRCSSPPTRTSPASAARRKT